MKHSRKVIAFGCLLFISGCATVNYATLQPVSSNQLTISSESNHVFDKNYGIGMRRTAYVGQPIIRVKDYHVRTTASDASFVSTAPMTASWWQAPEILFPAGTNFPIVGMVTHENISYFAVSPPHPSYQKTLLLLDSKGQYNNLAYFSNGMILSPKDPTGIRYSPQEMTFERPTKEEVAAESGFTNVEVLYSGTTRDSIRMLYREYTPDNMARPAYSQELVYDFGPGTIRFRDFVINVISADNQQITYVVEADGFR